MITLKFLKSTEFKIFLTFFVIYSFFVSGMGFWENSVFFLTQSIVDKGVFYIDDYANQTTDRSIYKNHYYSDKNPGLSFILVPIYSLSKFFVGPATNPTGQYLVYKEASSEIYTYINFDLSANVNRIVSVIIGSSLFASLSVVLIYKISSFFTLDKKLRVIIAIFSGIATPVMYFGTLLFDVSVSIFLILLVFLIFLTLRVTSFKQKYKLVLLGLICGYSITVTPINGVILLILLPLSIFYMRKKIMFLIIGFLIGISPLFAYNCIAFENPFTIAKNFYDKTASSSGINTSRSMIIFQGFQKILFSSNVGLLTLYPIFLSLFFWCLQNVEKIQIRSVNVCSAICFSNHTITIVFF